MAKLTAAQIAVYARGAGLKDKAAVRIAVAVALAESGGNPRAHNPNPPDDSYGLWQINMLGGMGPARRKQWGLRNNDELYDPAKNAKAMYDLSSGGKNWTPWTTFTRGNYLVHLNTANEAANNPNVGVAVSEVANSSNPSALSWITDPSTYRRGGLVVVGALLLLGALVMLLWPLLKPAVSTVTKVAVARKVPTL